MAGHDWFLSWWLADSLLWLTHIMSLIPDWGLFWSSPSFFRKLCPVYHNEEHHTLEHYRYCRFKNAHTVREILSYGNIKKCDIKSVDLQCQQKTTPITSPKLLRVVGHHEFITTTSGVCFCLHIKHKKVLISSGVWSIEMSLHTHTNNSPHAFLIVQLNKVASQGEDGYTENNMLLSGLECYEAAHVRGLMGVICQIILSHRDGQDKVIQISSLDIG